MKYFAPSMIAVALTLSGCQATKQTNSNTEPAQNTVRAEQAYLTMEQAMKRSARVSQVDYELSFDLTGEESFNASTKVNFILNDASQDLTLDLDKAAITKLVINGQQVAPQYNQHFITLPKAQLVDGKNTIEVSFTRKHSTNGEGLHRFKDPVDGKVYLYSHFEPAAAHQMFALFDQPDLKANYQLTVNTPKNWVVSSAMQPTRTEQLGDKKRWYFDRTLKLSPYNFSMHAGPYQVFSDNSGKYPMRLLVRQSVANQVSPQDWFKYTKQGIGFFEDYFGIDYPFRKYDQVLVPDFLYGAMENAAAITFAEGGFLTNGDMSPAQKQRLASVILHEMAHQWFGNLVTMKWWNGLWLNESFAAFMQTMATAEATEFKSAWRTFYAYGKQSAYTQDSRITTHPIEVPVPSTANAFDNIDAITYSKGASVLNQLRHLLGEATFRRGIHNYLSQNAYQNAELNDFIQALADASGKDLSQWQQQWLYQAGVNTIEANYQCNDGKISAFSLSQSAMKDFPTLREQRVQVALFNIDNSGAKLTDKVAVTYNGEQTQVAELVGKTCPDLVYPNYQDWGFVKVNLDDKSFNTAKDHLAKVSDPLLRSMLWQSLFDSMRDAKLKLTDYIDIVTNNLPQEQDYTILGQVLSQLARAKGYLVKAYGAQQPQVKAVLAKLEQMAWENSLQLRDDKNMTRRWFERFISFAHSPEALSQLKAMLDGKKLVPNLTITQDMRWQMIEQLSRYQFADADNIIEAELAKDSSDTGQKSAIAARVLAPNQAVKAEWLAKIMAKDSDLPFSKLRTAMGSLYPSEQQALADLTAAERLAKLSKLDAEKGPVFMRGFNARLIPTGCSAQSVENLANAIATQKLSAGTMRSLKVAWQEDERCVQIKQKAALN